MFIRYFIMEEEHETMCLFQNIVDRHCYVYYAGVSKYELQTHRLADTTLIGLWFSLHIVTGCVHLDISYESFSTSSSVILIQ